MKLSPQKLKVLIAKSGVRKSDLAKILGCSKTSISRYLRGDHTPHPDRLEEMAKFLGCKVIDMLDVDEDEEKNTPIRITRISKHYNRYGKTRLEIGGNPVWQTENPHILKDSLVAIVNCDLPEDIAQYLIKCVVHGVEFYQEVGLQAADTVLDDALTNQPGTGKSKHLHA
jgi:transcriptional regulator with XRE-family HTH domain